MNLEVMGDKLFCLVKRKIKASSFCIASTILICFDVFRLGLLHLPGLPGSTNKD